MNTPPFPCRSVLACTVALLAALALAPACGSTPEDTGTGGGASTLCRPGETRTCYEGPSGTKGVGICVPGLQRCNAEGTGWGSCEGQVLPGTETCDLPGDEDCDGKNNEDCACTPGATESCYSGPPEVVGIGACKAGERVCLPDGAGFGPCTGEVFPAPEVCFSPLDESCDGIEACTGGYSYSVGFSSLGDEALQVAHIAVAPNGRAYLIGHILDSITIGNTTLDSAGGWDVVVLAFDPKGNLLWGKQFGDPEDQRGTDIAVDASGNVLITGTFTSNMDVGTGVLATTGPFDADIFVAKLDADGNAIWAQSYGDPSPQAGGGIAAGPAGKVFFTGAFNGTIDIGKGPMTSAGGHDVLVARLASDGTAEWSARFGDAADQTGIRIAADPVGGAFVTGDLNGTINFGGGPLTSAGLTDIYLAHFDAVGKHIMSARYGGVGIERGSSVAALNETDAALSGFFTDDIDFGAGPIMTTGSYDGFVARIGPDGKSKWQTIFGGDDTELATDVSVDGAGNIVTGGTFVATMSYPGGTKDSAGAEDVFVCKFDGDGKLAWLQAFGDPVKQETNAVATDALGDVFVAGRYYGMPDFGGGPLPMPSGVGGFLVKLTP